MPVVGTTRSHPDLAEQRLIFGKNFHDPGAPPIDDHGHGTHVMGILSARRNNREGIAGFWPEGRVVAYKVFNRDNIGTDQLFNNAVLEALEFAEGAGARLIINYSGEGPDTLPRRPRSSTFARKERSWSPPQAIREHPASVFQAVTPP